MKIIGIKRLLVTVLVLQLVTSCSTAKEGKNPSTVAEAEAQLAKKEKIKQKEASKAKKEAEKNFWKRQTKSAKKSIKKNKKRQEKLARKKRGH